MTRLVLSLVLFVCINTAYASTYLASAPVSKPETGTYSINTSWGSFSGTSPQDVGNKAYSACGAPCSPVNVTGSPGQLNCTTGSVTVTAGTTAYIEYCTSGTTPAILWIRRNGSFGSMGNITISSASVPTGYTCDARAWCTPTASAPYTCSAGDSLANDGRTCATTGTCSSSSTVSSGYYDMGTSKTAASSAYLSAQMYCASGCLAYPSYYGGMVSAVVSGTTHYFFQGVVKTTGGGPSDACTAGTTPNASAAPSSLSAVPQESCASGTYKVVSNGKTSCVSSSTNLPVSTGPQYVVGTSCSNATNADSTITQTCVTTNADGSQTTKSTTYAAGTSASSMQPLSSTSSTTSTDQSALSGSGVVAGSSSGTAAGSSSDLCASHPDAIACQSVSPGTASGTSDLYSKDQSGKTFETVIADRKAELEASSIYGLASSVFGGSVASASCNFNGSFDMLGRTFTVDMNSVMCGSTMATVLALCAAGLLAIATVVAYKIALL